MELATPLQVLSFVVGAEEYAIEILRVQEIRCYSAITPIPNAPPHVKGVMNLRGAVVPIIDLRVRLGLGPTACTNFTAIILVNMSSKILGLIVDSVSDVLQIPAEAVTPPPDFGGAHDTSCLRAIARVEERLLGLVDVDVIGNVRGDALGEAA